MLINILWRSCQLAFFGDGNENGVTDLVFVKNKPGLELVESFDVELRGNLAEDFGWNDRIGVQGNGAIDFEDYPNDSCD